MRCTAPTSDQQAKHYRDRGITICDRWRNFANFLRDLGPRPARKTLDRIDNDGNYEPTNCRWATRFEQAANRHEDEEEIEDCFTVMEDYR